VSLERDSDGMIVIVFAAISYSSIVQLVERILEMQTEEVNDHSGN
jgi:hypothetical protein